MAAKGFGSESSPIVISDDEDEVYVCQQLFEQDVDIAPPNHLPRVADHNHDLSSRQTSTKGYGTMPKVAYQRTVDWDESGLFYFSHVYDLPYIQV
jgi:hypothetical protein